MKVLDLQCAQGHGFEGWFASEDDFRQQLGSGFLTCPMCGEAHVTRLPSAPRLNLRAGDAPAHHSRSGDGENPSANAPSDAAPSPSRHLAERPAAAPESNAPVPVALQAAWLRAVRHVLTHTENVGERFADEARRIHHGEAPERGIRGKASLAETEALQSEGIEVLPLPIPEGMDGPVQ